MRTLRLLLLPLLIATPAVADEGQWPPGMLPDLDGQRLKDMGLELPASALWSDSGGLLRAVVNYGGCSGGFISKDGLVATNHHCAYGALQAASSVDHDYLKEGFVARSRSEEIQAKGRGTLWILSKISDVTAQIRRAAAGAEDDKGRRQAVNEAKLTIEEACEGGRSGVRCDVETFFFGARYELHESIELRDLRVVFAPPSAVGEFGGEVDNWMWPRHSADFALLRAYVDPNGEPADYSPDNVPYHPEQVLKIGHEGVGPGDFVAILGYPGRTKRYLWSDALSHHVEHELPKVIDTYGEWIDLLKIQSQRNRDVAIKVAALSKGLANRHKNSRGMLAGIERMKLLPQRTKEGHDLLRIIKESKDLKGAQTLGELRKLSASKAEGFERDFLLEQLSRGPRMLWVALTLAQRAQLRDTPDAERPPQFQERNSARLKRRIDRVVADFDVEVETALLSSWLNHAAKLPARSRILAVDEMTAYVKTTPDRRAGSLLNGTLVRDPKWVDKAFATASLDELRHAQGGLTKLGIEMLGDIQSKRKRDDRRAGTLIRLAPDYLRLLSLVRLAPLYPDANGTLRVSIAQVQGYAPKDGLLATPQTTLQGQLQKHTSVPPFDLPERVRKAAPAARKSYFADPVLQDVPVCFLSNGDTTGGNSGSPVIDGKGQWVGLNFDRVWENIAGDIAYNPPQSRNISVDVRYILWLLSITEGTAPLLEELGIDTLAKQSRREPTPLKTVTAAKPAQPAGKAACSCVLPANNVGGLAWAWVLVGLLGRRRRG